MSTPQVHNIHRLSFLQEGLLFHTVEDPDAAFYVDLVVYRLYGDLDLQLFTRAWELVVQRHAVLRTSFHWRGISELVQVVHDQVQVPVETLDWRDKPAEAQQQELEEFVGTRRQSGFELEHPPLLRLTLIRYAEQEYRFCFGYHHILIDAWSGLMVLEEALSYYDELTAGRTPELTPAPSFHDYVTWVRSQDLDVAERFWRQRLEGLTQPPSMPIIAAGIGDRPHEAVSEHPERVEWISVDTVRRLDRIARTEQLTLSALVQTCWAVLLHGYTGADDVVFGGTISSRPPELEDATSTAGLFINSLPLRVRLDPAEPVIAVSRRLQHELGEIRRYDFSPLAQVQQWSDAPAGQPLFDTLTTVLNVPGIGALRRRDGAISLRDGNYHYRTNYPLSLLVIPEDDELALRIGFDPSRVHAEDVERLLRHLLSIVETVATDPERAVADVPLVGGAERERLLREWAGEDAAYDGERLAHQLIEDVADRHGAATAVRHGGQELSYAELDHRANQLAHHLQAAGVGPDHAVGLCLPRSVERLVAQVAILKAGGCFLPLDPTYPSARLEAMLSEADVGCLVSDRERRGRLPRTGGHTVLIDAHAERIAARPAHRPDPPMRPNHLAYVIYTSGSTGRPKGVQIPHAGLVNLMHAQAERIGIQPSDRVLQWAAATFDASVWDVFLALGAGATLHLTEADRVVPGEGLLALLREERVTALTITPSALAALGSKAPHQLPDLRLVVLAGEALSAALVRRWSTPGRRILNAYGPTETTVCATIADLTGPPASLTLVGDPAPAGSPTSVQSPESSGYDDLLPIGTPISGARVRVFDPCGRPVPIGVPGELYVGGAGLARGYLNQPEQTAERFIADPYADQPGTRLYRTGDLVCWRSDGQLEFRGRMDRQLKVRGFRVEAGEIEAALGAQEGVGDCAVIAHRAVECDDDATLPDTLTAYFVPDPAAPLPSADALRQHLARSLPDYMVPATIHALRRLPLTANGKLDEPALPAAVEATETAATEAATARPRTVAEEAVVRLWADVLGIAQIGVADDFFELGGNSIKATQVVSRVRRTWGADLPLRSLFEARTVERFATVLEDAVAF